MPKTASSKLARKKPASSTPAKVAPARASSARAAKVSSRKSRAAAVAEPAETDGPNTAREKHQNGNGNGNGAHSKKSDRRNGAAPVIEIPVGDPATTLARATRSDAPEAQEKLRELVKLAKEQGYITFDDLNEMLPESVNEPDELEAIMTRLRAMEIDIIDASEVDRYKDGQKAQESEEEEEKPDTKLDVLDDPVRMYLKQMGQVPLLTREQEVEISKRIEDAELMVQKNVNRFGFTARAHLDLAQKLIEGRER